MQTPGGRHGAPDCEGNRGEGEEGICGAIGARAPPPPPPPGAQGASCLFEVAVERLVQDLVLELRASRSARVRFGAVRDRPARDGGKRNHRFFWEGAGRRRASPPLLSADRRLRQLITTHLDDWQWAAQACTHAASSASPRRAIRCTVAVVSMARRRV